MKAHARYSLPLILLALVLIIVAGIALALPVQASPFRQNLPTPSPFPVENTPYTLEKVGGSADPVIFPGAEIDAFTLGETTVTSQYPDGMTFALKVSSADGDIKDVILFVRFPHGSGTRAVADYDPQTESWVAHLWETGSGQPAWTHFQFYWRVRDATDTSVESGPQTLDYWDPARQWVHSESEYLVLYWIGFGEDNPDEIAQKMADAMASTHQRRVDAFGRALSYKPITVIYPSDDALSEIYGGNATNDRIAGFTDDSLGMSVQILRDDQLVRGTESCPWTRPVEYWTMEHRINTLYNTVTHEVAHLYQYEIMGGLQGYLWVYEGQADWLSLATRNYDERLRYLATLDDVPSLTTNIGWQATQADGCYALGYYMGASFYNWLNFNYGGIETHRKIMELMHNDGKSIYEAVEAVTGKPFLEVENEWRVYLGYPPLELADIDPASALQPPVDPLAQEGETLTLPAAPPFAPLYQAPGPRQLANGQCFANMQVKIVRVGSLDGVDYYQVDCMGMVGWMTRDQLVGPQ